MYEYVNDAIYALLVKIAVEEAGWAVLSFIAGIVAGALSGAAAGTSACGLRKWCKLLVLKFDWSSA